VNSRSLFHFFTTGTGQRIFGHLLYPFHTYAVQAAVLCGSTTAENRRKPQIYRRWTAHFRNLLHIPRVLAEKLNMLNFSARILRKAVKRKETVKTMKEPYWPQAKRDLPWPSTRQPQPSAKFRRPTYLRLSYCPNCALLSNHFLTHNVLHLFILRLSLAASSASFCLFVLTMTIAAPAVRARTSMTHRCSICVLLLCGNRVSTSSDCILSNFSCCLQMTAKSSIEVHYNRRGSVRWLPKPQISAAFHSTRTVYTPYENRR